MSSSDRSKSIERRMESLEQEEKWRHNIRNAQEVTEIISSSVDMINLEGRSFHAIVHKELFCYFSPYYTTLLEDNSSKVRETIKLNLSKHLAQALVRWLYTGTLPETGEDVIDLINLYCFANERKMLALRRSIMSRIIDSEHPQPEEVLPYLDSMPEDSTLFRYVVDQWAGVWSQTRCWLDMSEFDGREHIPRSFFYQALTKLAEMVKDKTTHMAAMKVVCNYHEHLNIYEWDAN
ncbi:hypothetical protein E4T44_04588 [Aureobasidium sp. EXF-8845]|nr:hypothetical protein E4T44_04588 [Aureobasidium sp. EXF-8845]